MSLRVLIFVFALSPFALHAQSSVAVRTSEPPNATMRAVLMANCPERITPAEWLLMMERPVNRTLFPLRITQAVIDTLDARLLDPQFQYVILPNKRPCVR